MFLGSENEFFLYDQYTNGLHFCVKPELTMNLLYVLQDVSYFKENVDDTKKHEEQVDIKQNPWDAEEDAEMSSRKPLEMQPQPILKRSNWAPHIFVCCSCKAKLGNICPIGPKGEYICCFTAASVHIVKNSGTALSQTKWEIIRPFIGQVVEVRDTITFYGLLGMDNVGKFDSPPLKMLYPSFEYMQKVNLKELIVDKPRSYQIECFIHASLQNTIIYLPTGAGKTLVAALLTALMHNLNPYKSVLFVVHRVSLAFQQAQYIKDQTGLDVLTACGNILSFIVIV